jgi:hypothetical protein
LSSLTNQWHGSHTTARKMKTEIASKFDEIIFITNGSRIEEMTYGEYCREYGGDETTSPRGIVPRMHVRPKDGDVYQNMDSKELISEQEYECLEEIECENYSFYGQTTVAWEIWSWGVGGNHPSFTGTSFDNEADAYNEIMEKFEYNATNKNDNAPSYYSTQDEAIAAWAAMEQVSTYSINRFLKVKEYRKQQAK